MILWENIMKTKLKDRQRIKMYSALEVADICGVVNQTAINWIISGHLKAVKTPGGQYRIYREDLIRFLNERHMYVPSNLMKEGINESAIVINSAAEENNVLSSFLSLQLPSFNIYRAFDVFNAGILLARFKPFLIFLDFDCKEIPAEYICRQIRLDTIFCSSYIVALTANPPANFEDSFFKRNTDFVFKKPLDYVYLLNELGSIVEVNKVLENKEAISVNI